MCAISLFSFPFRPIHAVAGDVLVLTKPLGTNVVTNVHQWLEHADKWARVSNVTNADEGNTKHYGTATNGRYIILLIDISYMILVIIASLRTVF